MIIFLLSLTLYVSPASDVSQAALDQSGAFTMMDDYNARVTDCMEDSATFTDTDLALCQYTSTL